jgi:hypothetical protein
VRCLPGLRAAARVYAGPAGSNPAGTCPSSIARDECCGADLRASVPQRLAPGSAVLAAQRWMNSVLTTAAGSQGSASTGTLGDVGIVGSWVLRSAPASYFAGYGQEALAAWHQWHEEPPATRDRPRRRPPSSAILTAVLAMTMLTGNQAQAIGRIRALLPPAARASDSITGSVARSTQTGSRARNAPPRQPAAPGPSSATANPTVEGAAA